MTLEEYRLRIRRHVRDFGELQWTDPMIDEVLNDGYRNFVERTHCLRKQDTIKLATETDTFSLPTDCIRVYRIEHNKRPVEILSDDVMDATYGIDWREFQGNAVTVVTMQMTGPGTLRIFPIFRDFDGVVYDIDEIHDKLNMSYDGGADTVVEIANNSYSGDDLATQLQSDINDEFSSSCTVTFDGDTGKFTLDADAGHTFAIMSSGSTAAERIGVFADETDTQIIITDESVRLWLDYVYRPTELASTSDYPDFPEEYHPALYHYVLHELLLHEVESKQSQALAHYHLSKYEHIINRVKVISDTDFARTEKQIVINPWL